MMLKVFFLTVPEGRIHRQLGRFITFYSEVADECAVSAAQIHQKASLQMFVPDQSSVHSIKNRKTLNIIQIKIYIY